MRLEEWGMRDGDRVGIGDREGDAYHDPIRG